MTRSALHVQAALVLTGAVAAQLPQEWVQLDEPHPSGVFVPQSPWPLLIGSDQNSTDRRAFEFAAGRLFDRPEQLPPVLWSVQATCYDPVHRRLVAYCATVDAQGSWSVVMVFDGARWTQVSSINPPPPRVAPALAFDPTRGSVLLFGGEEWRWLGLQPLGDTWELRGSTWTQIPVVGPPPRASASLSAAPGAGLVLFGGRSGLSHLGDTWLWNGSAWAAQAPANPPAARARAALARDPRTGTTVLYGGSDGSAWLGDAHAYDGIAWSPLPTPALPPLPDAGLASDGQRLLLLGSEGRLARLDTFHVLRLEAGGWTVASRRPSIPFAWNPMVAYDEPRREIVRFGGTDSFWGTVTNETWTWNRSWQRRLSASVPAPRQYGAMVFDPVRQEIVLFGGGVVASGGSTYFGDTWSWDGTSWRQRTPVNSPSRRLRHSMAFDPGRGTVVLFGGWGDLALHADTWEWDGTNWRALTLATNPPPASSSMAYDAARQVMAMHVDLASALAGVWELRSGGWVQASALQIGSARLVYDPTIRALSLFTGGQRLDQVGGTWRPSSQLPLNGAVYVTDPLRGVFAVEQHVRLSTAVAAQAQVYGDGCADVTLGCDHVPGLGAPVQLRVRSAPGTSTWLALGTSRTEIELPGGCRAYVGGPVWQTAATSPPIGWTTVTLMVPAAPALLGLRLFAQAATFDGLRFGTSNGLSLRLGL